MIKSLDAINGCDDFIIVSANILPSSVVIITFNVGVNMEYLELFFILPKNLTDLPSYTAPKFSISKFLKSA